MDWTDYTPLLPTIGAALCLAAIGYGLSEAQWRSRSRGLPFPPGPAGIPLLGNIFDMPEKWPWIEYQRLGTLFGDVVHLRVLGQSVVVLNSPAVISEYLEKHTVNTADRAQSLMVELTGNGHNLGFMRYGTRWRDHRRVFWQYFNKDAARAYQPTQRAVTHIYLEKVLTSPERFQDHIRYTLAGSVMHVAYGIDYTSEKPGDEYSEAMRIAILSVVEGLVPGKFLVQYFPFLRHLPSWVPGTGWQQLFRRWREQNRNAIMMPYNYARAEMHRQKDVQDSMVGRHVARLERAGGMTPHDEEVLQNTSALAFEAGADTTLSSLQGGFLALALHPEVVKKAQDELDIIVGPTRLPEFDDEPHLVYVKAVIMEVMRWHNVLPLSVAHGTTHDDVWRDWFIPAGTVILPNVWGILHDPQMFPDPLEFRPERFIKDGAIDTTLVDPMVFVFGYGRRDCPGRHFARAGLFINIASLLHVFRLSDPLDSEGKPITVPRFTGGVLSYPEAYSCTITPRSESYAELIRTSAAAARTAMMRE